MRTLIISSKIIGKYSEIETDAMQSVQFRSGEFGVLNIYDTDHA